MRDTIYEMVATKIEPLAALGSSSFCLAKQLEPMSDLVRLREIAEEIRIEK